MKPSPGRQAALIASNLPTNRKEENWEHLHSLLEKARRGGLKALSALELRELWRLYRTAASDLSLARARGRDDIALYLNQLVAQAHGLIYARPSPRGLQLSKFFLFTIPRLFRVCGIFWLAALCIWGLGSGIGFVLTSADPAWAEIFVGLEMRTAIESFVKAESPPGRYFADTAALFGRKGFSSLLMINNIQVALLAFALGISAGFGTFYVLWRNALMLGAALGLAAYHHKLLLMIAVVAPHGFVEISAVLMAGAAGLRLGWALIAPGDLRRQDALRLAGQQTGPLVLGTIPLFIFAGLVEGLISPLHQGLMGTIAFRMAFGLGTSLLLYLWLFSGFGQMDRSKEHRASKHL